MKSIFAFVLLLTATSSLIAQTATAPSGSGTPGDPYLIATLGNLYWITQNSDQWNKVYKQTADIDATSTSSWSGGTGLTPIGNATTQFNGSYDGQGYAIKKLFINSIANDYVGLFGNTVAATISDVRLDSVNFVGNDYVGSLIGYQQGHSSVRLCSSSGTISGASYVGGLIGQQSDSHVDSCSSSASVTSTVAFGGGLVGYQYFSTVAQSFSEVNVVGVNTLGGLIGMSNSSDVSNSYSTSSVNASGQEVGGLLGSQGNSSTASNCYSIGTVSGLNNLGGLIGYQFSLSTTSNCFWDSVSSSQSSSADGVGKNTTEMKTQSTFLIAGWSSAIWNIGDGINNGYPYLKWQNIGGSPLPVEILTFSANVFSLSVTLKWTTAMEVNTAGFDVEYRPVNSQQWDKIGFVASAGSSNAPSHYSFTDNVGTTGLYSFRLKLMDRDGSFTYSKPIELEVGTEPKVFSLSQNYPNPFNPTTTIQFSLPRDGRATLKVYNAVGQEVATLFEGTVTVGEYHQVTFDASLLATGSYFYRLRAGSFSATRKLVVLK